MQSPSEKIYDELSQCLSGEFNMKLAMRLHAKYSKSHANKMKVAKRVAERKKLLKRFLGELLALYQPAGEPKIKQVEPEKETLKVKLQKPVAEKLKSEFPKLNFADLPDNLKILVINRYSAWESSKQKHSEQHSATNDEDRFIAARDTVENIIENWKIWEELEHYQKYGKPLGQHSSFIINDFEAEITAVEKLSVTECIKALILIRNRARNNINRLLKIKKDGQQLSEEQNDLLKTWIFKFDYVSVKLNEPKWEKS